MDSLPKPWTLRHNDDAYWVEAANGARFGFCYFRDPPVVGTNPNPARLTRDCARRMAVSIWKLGR